jgi:hypothetical protein
MNICLITKMLKLMDMVSVGVIVLTLITGEQIWGTIAIFTAISSTLILGMIATYQKFRDASRTEFIKDQEQYRIARGKERIEDLENVKEMTKSQVAIEFNIEVMSRKTDEILRRLFDIDAKSLIVAKRLSDIEKRAAELKLIVSDDIERHQVIEAEAEAEAEAKAITGIDNAAEKQNPEHH